MFRDLKEYQEIAKIYAEKVSKPENLEERVRGGGMKTSGVPAPKPVTVPQKGAGGGSGNPTNVRGSGAGTVKPIVRGAQGRTKRPQPEIKKFPSTAEIRAANQGRVGGGNAGASTDSGGTQGQGGAPVVKKTVVKTVVKKPEVSTMTKQGQPRTKAQMMAAKRIADGKSIADVKAANTASMKAKAAERNQKFQDAKKSGNLAQFRKDNPKMSGKEKAQAMAKARLAAKNKPVAGGSAPKATPASGMPTRKVTSSTTQSGNTTSTRTKVTSGTGGGTAGLTSSAGSLEANKKKAAKLQAIADKNAAMENYTPYDIVLEYLLSTEQAATIEEANYVMTEMDGKTINDIVEMQGQINRADIIGGTQAAKNAASGKGKYTPGKGVTKDFKLDPSFKLPKV